MYSSDSLYRTLLQINNILVREVSPEKLFRSLAQALQPVTGCDRCSLSIYNRKTDTLSWFAQAEGTLVTRMDEGPAPLRGPLARKAIRENRPIFVASLDEYAEHEAIRLMIAAGLRSSMAFPLVSRSRVIGVLILSFKRHLDPDEGQDRHLCGLLEEISTQVALAVENMLIHDALSRQNTDLAQQVTTLLRTDAPEHDESRFFYQGDTMRKLMGQLHTLARSDVAVLICGETGTGKEFMARFIHRHSPRRTHNFVKVNCPALSPTLFESELFGHAKGAFTGAYNGRIGRFELANKGSIFLDEIGDLDISLQAKLLHVLQDAKLERVGESASINIDVRCISATNADLHQQMRTQRFRRDLFYRLGLVTVQAPSLRDRQEELEPMFFHLMRLYAEDRQCVPVKLHPDALAMLKGYHWPGNIRELSNLVARLLILHPGGSIGPEHVAPLLEQGEAVERGTRAALPAVPAVMGDSRREEEDATLAAMEKKHIERMLFHANGRVSGDGGAAQLLGLPRSTLQYKLQKHGIHPKMFRRKARQLQGRRPAGYSYDES
ncbi:MAG: sigma-54-dependent Fis family transcriptional regulator [Deltaproteobacteria bacterium]|jgi:transcriptional regulator with GAF, ATPase, and Fis domain|nr:sigma-54-dependent Fis family transcriptional regulator [Deltaproteobacteria bacterium]